MVLNLVSSTLSCIRQPRPRHAEKDLQAAITNASVRLSVLLELIANRKTVLGAHHADHEKMGMTEEQLAQAYAVGRGRRLGWSRDGGRRPGVYVAVITFVSVE